MIHLNLKKIHRVQHHQKNDGKSNNVPIQGSTDTQTKPTEVDTKKHEELEKINKETEDALNDMKEDDEELKRFMSLVDARVKCGWSTSTG